MARTPTARPEPDGDSNGEGAPPKSSFDIVGYNDAFHRTYKEDSRTGRQFRFTMYVVLVSRRWRARVAERLRKTGQSTARWEALFSIAYADGEVTQNRLARRLAIEGPTMVRMIHALEKDGLVQRTASERHRGAKVILLTDKGRDVVTEIDNMTRDLRDRLFAGIGDDDIDEGVGFMRDLFLQLRDSEGWDLG